MEERDTLIDGAKRHVRERGYARTTARDIARAADGPALLRMIETGTIRHRLVVIDADGRRRDEPRSPARRRAMPRRAIR
ncbi:TetR family transcriptional regulator [Microtetraspora malaysiensis]|uniref:TetR family transcriptional regulator n=1 Tax=Microtetraspora malaysiensis TaxID=161358 RepID=UPI000B2713CE